MIGEWLKVLSCLGAMVCGTVVMFAGLADGDDLMYLAGSGMLLLAAFAAHAAYVARR